MPPESPSFTLIPRHNHQKLVNIAPFYDIREEEGEVVGCSFASVVKEDKGEGVLKSYGNVIKRNADEADAPEHLNST